MKKTILLVEDSKIQKLRTETILIKAGYLVLCAEDGQEALRLANEALPDLIVLDMLLPKLRGQEVLLALKTNAVTARIPIVILTELPQTNEGEMRRAGAEAYFEKSRLFSNHAVEKDFLATIDGLLQAGGSKGARAASVGRFSRA